MAVTRQEAAMAASGATHAKAQIAQSLQGDPDLWFSPDAVRIAIPAHLEKA